MKKNTLLIRASFTLVFLLTSLMGFAQSSQTYNTSGTYTFTVPLGVTSISFQSWGAGGAGTNRGGAAAGGGGGAYTGGTITGLTPGDEITIFVGTGGAVGSPGQNTTINGTIIANGGGSTDNRTGGTGGAASGISDFITASYSGGNGGDASGNNGGPNNEAGGGGGGSAFASGAGNIGANGGASPTSTTAGGTGTATGGLGATASGNPDATAGNQPGGGGGGRGEGTSTSKSGGQGQVTLHWIVSPTPTITSLGSTSSCVGSSITINGANLTGATASGVKIGGTAVSSISSNTGTVLVAVVGSGTSGTVSVTTAGGTATSGATFTVNSLPTANPGSALSAICQGGTTVALGGSFGGSATSAIWSDGGVGGTFTNNTGSTPNTTSWTPPGSYSGTATLTLTTSGGSCGATTASKTQVVTNGTLFATVGTAQKIYVLLISSSLGGNAPGGTTGAWSKVFGPGIVTFSSITSATATATVSTYGDYVFRWSLNSACGVTTADITVTYARFKDPEYTISYDNFDNNNGGWTASTASGTEWTYTNNSTSAHVGEGSFWSVNNYTNNSLTYLTSPTIITTGYTNVKLSIDIRYDTNNDINDGIQIQYSTDNGGNWVVLGSNTSTWYTATNVTSCTNSLGWNGINSSVSAPLSQFEERSIQLNSLNNLPSLKFRAVFASDGSNIDTGVAIDNIIIKGDPITPFANPVAGPGSINSDLKLWLKSNTGTSTTTDGNALSIWNDQAYNNSPIGINGYSPIYRNNATRNINYNPVVDFDAAALQIMKGKGGYWSQDYYVVLKTNGLINNTATTRQVPISGRMATSTFNVDGTALGLGNFTARYVNEMVSHNISSIPTAPTTDVKSYGRAYTSTADSYNQETIIFNIKTNSSGTATEIYKNGKRIDNTTGQTVQADQVTFSGTMNFSELNNSQFNLGVGRFTLSGNVPSYLNGRMTEVVSYSYPKSAIEQQKIQSYLGIKNGITLHNTNSTTPNDLCDVDYIDSNGTIIWNSSNNNGYNYDIAGIGRDDNTLLNQKQSKTENPTQDISIGLGDLLDINSNNFNTFDSDKKFLVWGNNHGTLAAQPQVKVNMSTGITPALISEVTFISVGRTWKLVETGGNVGTTKVSIPTVMLSATLTPPGDYLMFISSTPNFDPTAEYRIMRANGSNLETDYDFDNTKYITFGFAPEKTFVSSISFDGTNDYLDAGKVLNLNTSFTVSSWIKRNSTNKTILSKRNSTFTTGYDLSINSAGRAEMSWMNGTKQTITSSAVVPSGIWHNVAVTYTETTAKLYIDGVLDVTKTMSTVPANTQSFLIAAADGVTPTSFFAGGIDEVRVWNVALTDKQLRYVMNQEVLSNGLATNGRVIPNTIILNEISPIPWANLSAYYPMSTYTYTNAKDISSNNYTAALRNLTTVDRQTAPLPYESATDGQWQTASTWSNNTVQDLPNSLSIVDGVTPVNWNIVRTSHNISSTGNKTILGLMVSSQTITASNDTKIEVTNYLKLDGKIDLVGMSQLVQTLNSDLDVTSAGFIERDQQGQANFYNYNYWCSPVSTINSSATNTNYTVALVMKDGTSSTPANINWIAGYNALISVPISVARFWLYKFDNYANSYSNWVKITENSALRVGQGFTMKGSGSGGNQNYTFVGKPNNGLINSNTILPNQLILTGNPYPSAMDADAFINDNAGSIDRATDGTLYFWEHYLSNNTHVLKEYQGGYGVKNLVGGVAPVSSDVDFISQSGTTCKSDPKRYIPVGQGFFVNGRIGSGGTIIFNNNQRAFFTETDTPNSNSLYKQRPTASKPAIINHWNSNSNDTAPKNAYKKVRLGFNSSNNYHRQVLLGFMNEKATSKMDYGYDGISLDDIPNDMYFLNSENQLVIQGEGYFDENSCYPIGVKTAVEGKVSFRIDALENISDEQKIYIYDDETKIYNEIQKNYFEVNMPVGVNNTRFSLRFKDKSMTTDKTLSLAENNTNTEGIKIAHIQNNNTIKINNNSKETTVEKVTLFNINGQSIASWNIENQDQQNIQIPVNSISSGVYIAKLTTTTGDLSKKLIIK